VTHLDKPNILQLKYLHFLQINMFIFLSLYSSRL